MRKRMVQRPFRKAVMEKQVEKYGPFREEENSYVNYKNMFFVLSTLFNRRFLSNRNIRENQMNVEPPISEQVTDVKHSKEAP